MLSKSKVTIFLGQIITKHIALHDTFLRRNGLELFWCCVRMSVRPFFFSTRVALKIVTKQDYFSKLR